MGNRMGADIRITATGGRKKPATSRKMLIEAIRVQRFTSRPPIHSAIAWVTKSAGQHVGEDAGSGDDDQDHHALAGRIAQHGPELARPA